MNECFSDNFDWLKTTWGLPPEKKWLLQSADLRMEKFNTKCGFMSKDFYNCFLPLSIRLHLPTLSLSLPLTLSDSLTHTLTHSLSPYFSLLCSSVCHLPLTPLSLLFLHSFDLSLTHTHAHQHQYADITIKRDASLQKYIRILSKRHIRGCTNNVVAW